MRAGSPTTLTDVLTRLEAMEAAAPPGDGVSYFTHLYRTVTAALAAALAGTTFHDPDFLQRLDLAFAGLYFEALDDFATNSPKTPRAWYPLFAARSRTDIAPIQFALAGMNAHINRDLMVALVQACGEKGIAPRRDSPEYDDYVAVNAILEAAEAASKAEFLRGMLADVDKAFAGIDDIVANWSISEARSAAWAHAETLWALRGIPGASSVFIDTIDGLVGFAGRGLLVPTEV